jgi:hypothetical protein
MSLSPHSYILLQKLLREEEEEGVALLPLQYKIIDFLSAGETGLIKPAI